MDIFNKLVRDNIPEIIASDGRQANIRVLSPEDYRVALLAKLAEEADEAKKAADAPELLKELGDVYEVIDAIISAFSLDKEAILACQQSRRAVRGGFERRIFLESVV